MSITIRLATASDLSAINRIFNYYVINTVASYQLVPTSTAERAEWFESHDMIHPVTVAEMDGLVVGWGALSRFRSQPAYLHTVENSVYVDREYFRRGIGRLLMADLCARARELGHHTIIAVIDGEQEGSLALHEKFGFVRVGVLREAGFKFGRWLDVVYMQKMM